ncbi:MAG TPA: FtsW/RodA/SpoVE family cell cycle protein [Solirubrobacteraceae bacterium]|jgi:rod shape determining protein RodA|nr:FtsW/RodA/SpoVE family cell cycle protein [Solirubrobacteraceae bacterium]
MSPLSPITAPEAERRAQAAAQEPRRGSRLLLDPVLTLTVLALGICSVAVLGWVTSEAVPGQPHYYSERQIVYLAIGLIGMVVLARIDYARLRHYKVAIYTALILSLLAVLGAGSSANGSVRAISFPLFSFQGSEIGKVLLIAALAALVVDRSRQLHERETTARVMLAALLPTMIVIAQPDLGSGLVYVAIALTLLFVAGVPWSNLAGLLALGGAAIALVLVAAPAVGVQVLKPYEVERFTAFLHPTDNPEHKAAYKASYQQLESTIAIGSGQRTGSGANSTQIKGEFVPEDSTDFVFAAVGERYGFVGAALVLSLYALLIWRTLRILTLAKDLFGALVAGGVVAMLMFQVFVNVGVAVDIMPVTGVTLPLMSYGGSSVIATLLAVGLLQSIYVRARAAEALKGRVPR